MHLADTTPNSRGVVYMWEQVRLEKDFTSVTVYIVPELADQKYISG